MFNLDASPAGVVTMDGPNNWSRLHEIRASSHNRKNFDAHLFAHFPISPCLRLNSGLDIEGVRPPWCCSPERPIAVPAIHWRRNRATFPPFSNSAKENSNQP